jgi:hypothetical protein
MVTLFQRKIVFRVLLILPWLTPLLGVGFPPHISNLLRAPAWYVGGVVSTLLLSFATAIGCWLFWRWARFAYLPIAVMYTFFIPLGLAYTTVHGTLDIK